MLYILYIYQCIYETWNILRYLDYNWLRRRRDDDKEKEKL